MGLAAGSASQLQIDVQLLLLWASTFFRPAYATQLPTLEEVCLIGGNWLTPNSPECSFPAVFRPENRLLLSGMANARKAVNGCFNPEVMMNTAKSSPHRTAKPRRPVPEILLELAYRLHTTRVVARPVETRTPRVPFQR